MRSASAATMLGVSRRTLMRWTAEHSVPHYKIGGLLFFDEGEVLDFVKAHRVEPEGTR